MENAHQNTILGRLHMTSHQKNAFCTDSFVYSIIQVKHSCTKYTNGDTDTSKWDIIQGNNKQKENKQWWNVNKFVEVSIIIMIITIIVLPLGHTVCHMTAVGLIADFQYSNNCHIQLTCDWVKWKWNRHSIEVHRITAQQRVVPYQEAECQEYSRYLRMLDWIPRILEILILENSSTACHFFSLSFCDILPKGFCFLSLYTGASILLAPSSFLPLSQSVIS